MHQRASIGYAFALLHLVSRIIRHLRYAKAPIFINDSAGNCRNL